MSRRSAFSCFTIDALLGSSSESRASPPAARQPPPPQLSDADEPSTASTDCTTSSKLQYVVSCSRLEDICHRAPPPTTATAFITDLDQRQETVELRHAFRVYRPPSLDGLCARTAACSADVHTCAGDILATLQRRAMNYWYHTDEDVDNDHWRTPTSLQQCDEFPSARRPINDIITASSPTAGHLHSNGRYRPTCITCRFFPLSAGNSLMCILSFKLSFALNKNV